MTIPPQSSLTPDSQPSVQNNSSSPSSHVRFFITLNNDEKINQSNKDNSNELLKELKEIVKHTEDRIHLKLKNCEKWHF
jgi:hypothetical protein